jgi:hypothetical protein
MAGQIGLYPPALAVVGDDIQSQYVQILDNYNKVFCDVHKKNVYW